MTRKILFLAANPGLGQLRLDKEVKEIRESLCRSQNRDSFELVCEWAVSPKSLRRAIMDVKPNIIHFRGHGTGANGLVLESDNGGSQQFVSGEALRDLFQIASETQESKLECVLLNACYSEEQATVISQHIDYVIGMNNSISDLAAIKFAVGFYDALLAGQTIEIAYRYGQNAIDLDGIPENSTPCLIIKPTPSSLSLQTKIVEKTKDFVGRKYVFEAISQFIASTPNGYFEITGDPGMGKSSTLAKFVQDTNCIAHFNVQGSCHTTEEFLKSISDQLIQKYQLAQSPLPNDSKQYTAFLEQLLGTASRKRNGGPIIIAIDALDEVEQTGATGFNILHLPVYLPEGVYVVMTKRRGVELRFMTHSPKKNFSLLDFPAESRKDVCTYIQNRMAKSHELRERQIEDADFVNQLADKSQNNFMYLVYILNDIQEGLFFDWSLDTFPTGLMDYYQWHWDRMNMNEVKIKTLQYLANAREPVSLGWLMNRIKTEPADSINQILIEWRQFLHRVLEMGERKYTIYHASFRDFLAKKEELDSFNYTEAIIDDLISGLFEYENKEKTDDQGLAR